MAAARPALAAAGCSQCRLHVLGLFTGASFRHAPVIQPSWSYHNSRPRVLGPISFRRFSSLSNPNDSLLGAQHEQDAPATSDEIERGESEEYDENKVEIAAGQAVPNNIPWYLRVDPPTHIASLEPQPLPEVPQDSPPLIGALLEYASEEMGLDALTLLDLRKLDPPPALGPNLFMLFGTARSERHLNVSAGRLVRWLRAKHHVHADADGLLGPNERKTKLRRKARRAKLLGTMGTDEADDGIRTGWICVNLGNIDGGGAESTVIADDGRVSGFGLSRAGSTVVFQIMTEGRRAEMDLETLWTRSLNRSLGIKPEREIDPVEQAIMAGIFRPTSSSGSSKGRPHSSSQARFYSTQQQATPATTKIDPLSTLSPKELELVLTYDAHQKQRLLELLRTQLVDMDAETARLTLRRPDQDPQNPRPTPFMELMQLAMQTLPPTRTWEYRLDIQHKASVLGFLEPLDEVQRLIDESSIYGIKTTREQYLQLLTCVFYAEEKEFSTRVGAALDVINMMHQRSEYILASDLLVTLIESALTGVDRRPQAIKLASRLEQLLFQPKAPCMDEELLMRLMSAHAYRGNWNGVWNAWRVPARHLRPRSAKMYIHMFGLARASGSSTICTLVLRRCIPESNSEDPPVLSDLGVRRAALECIATADPRAEEFAELNPEDSRGTNPADIRGLSAKLARREFAKLTRLLNA